ncbi:MAG: hypothetical protein H0U75_01095 [Legionella sp.]|nr:hypothetical protein [Legionella sp.]
MASNDNKSQAEYYLSIQKSEAEFIQLILKRLGLKIRPQTIELHKLLLQACEKFNCSPDEYLHGLSTCRDNSPYLEHLIAGVTVGETYFFRDKKQMKLLQETLIPELIQKKRKSHKLSLRIWSAGCASGEEIYTLAIMLNALLPDIHRWTLHLLGTDINTKALQKATLGQYSKWSMRSIPKETLENYFTLKDNQYQIADKIRDSVYFKYLNLQDNTYPSLLNNTSSQDLILCRNVLIYFDSQSIKQLMAKFSKCLSDDGYLLLGSSDPLCIEGLGLFHQYKMGMILSPQKPQGPVETQQTPIVYPKEVKITNKNSPPDSNYTAPLIPTKEPTLLELANECANTGQLDKALQYCLQCIKDQPTNKDCYFTLGLTLIELNRLQEAETALRKSLFLDRKFVEGHFQLGLLLLKAKRKTEGLKCLQNALVIVNSNDPSQAVPNGQGLSYGHFADILCAEIDLYTNSKGMRNESN